MQTVLGVALTHGGLVAQMWRSSRISDTGEEKMEHAKCTTKENGIGGGAFFMYWAFNFRAAFAVWMTERRISSECVRCFRAIGGEYQVGTEGGDAAQLAS